MYQCRERDYLLFRDKSLRLFFSPKQKVHSNQWLLGNFSPESKACYLDSSVAQWSQTLRSHGSQHARLPCPSPSPRACSNSVSIKSVMLSNHLILRHPLLLLPSIFPSSKVFSNESALLSGGQSIGASASASVLSMNTQDWFPSGLTGLMSLQAKGLSRVFPNTTVRRHQFVSAHQFFFMVQLSHSYMTTGKTIALTRQTLVDKVMSLLFNMLSRFVIAFLPRSKHLLISWLQSPSEVILEPRKMKSDLFPLFPHLFAMK